MFLHGVVFPKRVGENLWPARCLEAKGFCTTRVGNAVSDNPSGTLVMWRTYHRLWDALRRNVGPVLFHPELPQAIWPCLLTNLPPLCHSRPVPGTSTSGDFRAETLISQTPEPLLILSPLHGRVLPSLPSPVTCLANSYNFFQIQCEGHPLWEVLPDPWSDRNPLFWALGAHVHFSASTQDMALWLHTFRWGFLRAGGPADFSFFSQSLV